MTPHPTVTRRRPARRRSRRGHCGPWGSDPPLRTFTAQTQEVSMSDDKSKQGQQDRSRVSGEEPYEVEYFAAKHGLSQQQARELIASVGNDRAELDR
ncbi:MAG: DUF3606 domain-containing protein, partial [Sphingomonas sp.]